MFERRLKILLLILGAAIASLATRAAYVQILQRDYWRQQAVEIMKRPHLVETTRGRILDVNGKVMAEDQPCLDACVDYGAITNPPDEDWLSKTALQRLHLQPGDPYKAASRAGRKPMLRAEMDRVQSDVNGMWNRLAKISGRSPEDIDGVREAIARRVEMRRRYAWYNDYQKAAAKQAASHEEVAAWKRWLLEGGSNMPDVDKFQVTVAEQLEPHVILPAIDNQTQNILAKDIDQYPGLVLRPGTHRFYPYHDVACHLLGQLSKVDRDDLKRNTLTDKDELREYQPNDLIGRTGIESLCEPALRGSRGKYVKVLGDERVVASEDPIPGKDVRLSIDVELQQQIQSIFADAPIRNSAGKVIESALLHGAAVVIDVKSGEVRALVSYPTFDENTFDEQYARLQDDDVNQPLLNRATMSQREPGSTVKPMVGLSAIKAGLLRVDETIECTGYLVLNNHKYSFGRCWVATKFYDELRGAVAHHPVPGYAPHPTGFLIFTDGLERSCNVFFETVADRFGPERLSDWFSRWGLGRPTGVGIAEAKGRLPRNYALPAWKRRVIGWFAGIGQDYVLATPLQMANVAATIARDGVWVRPSLLSSDQPPVATSPGALGDGPARVDLQMPPEAIKAAKLGMFRVVNSLAGTGTGLIAGDPLLASAMVAGKTGTAQASRMRVQKRDDSSHVIHDENGKPVYEFLEPSTVEKPNPDALWYRGSGHENKDLAHSWYIGFAPVDHPQIAFAVMVEYGGSGGVAAASVAREAIEGCIMRHYLTVKPPDVAAGSFDR